MFLRSLKYSITLYFTAFSLLFMPIVFAHVPLTTEENEDIESATYIPDPLKSWAVYSEIHGGEAQYYRFNLDEGQRLYVTLFTPAESEFTPRLVIMGPFESQIMGEEEHEHTGEGGVEEHEHEHEIPDFLAVPEGAEVMVVDVHGGEVTYEPFGPGSLAEFAKVDQMVQTAGTYYVTVYALSTGGKYGLAIGYLETWSIEEWIRIPLDMIGVHQWEGQPLVLILAPLLAVVAIGLGLMAWNYSKGEKPRRMLFGWIGSTAGLLCLGSGAIILTQMAIALSLVTVMPALGWISVTIIFALMPIIIGIATLRLAVKSRKITTRKRILIFTVGVAALFTWSGLYLGPALAMLAGILPTRVSALGGG
jgi:hypothetical protein